jgi:ligand-binding sensor domain-containing protein
MRMKIGLDASARANKVLVLAALVALLSSPHAHPAAVSQNSWLRAGQRYSLPSLEKKLTRVLPGRFSVLCSAKEVRALAVTDDTLWIGTEGGLFAWRMKDDAIVPVSGPLSVSVRAIAVDDRGALWVGGDHGISVRSNGAWKWYPEESLPLFARVRCMIPGETRFWIGGYGNGCGYVVGDAVTVLTARDSLLDERVLSIAEENASTVFFGTASGLVCADSLGWRSLRYGSRLPIGSVRDALFDEEGDLFLAIAGQGVAIYSFGRVRSFGAAGTPPGAEVNAFSLDSTGRVWAAGASGISLYDGSEWTALAALGPAAKKRRFLSIRHDVEGVCYAGTDDGKVLVIFGDDVRELAVPQAFPESRVSRIRLCGGTVWLAAGSDIYGVARDVPARAAAPPAPYGGEMTDIFAAEAGELWATTRFGILHYAGRAWEVFDRKNGLPTEYFSRVVKDPFGTVWFATFDGKLVAYAAGKWSVLGGESDLPAGAVEDLALDPAGNPWIVTRTGEVAHRIQGVWAKMELPRRENAAVDSARTSDTIRQLDPAIRFLSDAAPGSGPDSPANEYCLGFDREGACLVGSSAGVYRLGATGWRFLELPKTLRDARATAVSGAMKGGVLLGTAGGGILVWKNGEWSRLLASNGLSDDYIRTLCEDRNGAIWIGTQYGGVTKYVPPAGQ